jgi:hypothetical protein
MVIGSLTENFSRINNINTFNHSIYDHDYSLLLIIQITLSQIVYIITLTLSLLMSYIYIYGAPCTARNFNVVYIYGPMFGNAESRLLLFAAQCFNIESMQKVFLCHSCV